MRSSGDTLIITLRTAPNIEKTGLSVSQTAEGNSRNSGVFYQDIGIRDKYIYK